MRPPIVGDFYQSMSATPTPAFTAKPSNYATNPGGDGAPTTSKNTSTTWAKTVSDIVGKTTQDATFDNPTSSTAGYDAYKINGQSYQGYTLGPGYWGKTFFIWPPTRAIVGTGASGSSSMPAQATR